MEFVRAAANRNHDHAARVAAVLGGVVRGLDLHLLYGIEGGNDRLGLAILQAHDGRVVVHTVDEVVVLQRRLAVHAQPVAERSRAQRPAVATADFWSDSGAEQPQ